MDLSAPVVCRDNLKDATRQQIYRLLAQRKQVAELEAQLKALRKDTTHLEEELVPYKTHIMMMEKARRELDSQSEVHDGDLAPIHRCPDEVLQTIFELYLISSHDKIRCLLLVCVRWYEVIMDSPKLWARIHISCPISLFTHPKAQSKLGYIRACVERSRNVPLILDLDFLSFPSCSEYIKLAMRESAKAITDEGEHASICSRVGGLIWNYQSPLYVAKVDMIVDNLVGIQRTNLNRWSSLTLKLPTNRDLAWNIWKRFGGSFPSLEHLEITNIPEQPQEEQPQLFTPDFSNVRRLSISRTTYSLQHLSLSSTNLISLEITLHYTLSILLELSQFTMLRELGLRGTSESGQLSLPSPITLALPNLEILELGGCYQDLCSVNLEFPALKRLILDPSVKFLPLPRLSPQFIHWNCVSWLSKDLRSDISTLISTSPYVEKVVVNLLWNQVRVEATSCHCREDGELPFKHLTVIYSTDQRIQVDFHKFQEFQQALQASL